MFGIQPTEEEVREQLDRAIDQRVDNPGRYRGMSFEEGIIYALEWVLGDSDDKPLEDDD